MPDEIPTTEDALKAGRRHSSADEALLAGIHGKAGEIAQAALALGHVVPVEVQTIKGEDLPAATDTNSPLTDSIKAIGDGMTLDVLGVPFGGPNAGRDAHGEHFSARSKTYHEQFPEPLVVYYHGFTPDGKPQGEPVVIGKARYARTDGQGHWYRVVLAQGLEFAKRVAAAALKGMARASTGTIAHLKRVASDGEILNWPVVELSIFDTEGKRQPANQYAVALPALKSVYQQAGLTLPDFAESDGSGAPVAGGPDEANSNGETVKNTEIEMDEKELNEKIAAAVAAGFKSYQDAAAVEAERKAKEDERVAGLIATALAKQEAEINAKYAKGGRLPMGGEAPHQAQFADTRKYDAMAPIDLAFMGELLTDSRRKGLSRQGITQPALKALAIKMAEDKSDLGDEGRLALKAIGIDPLDVVNAAKADEVNYSTQAGFGDEWVGVEYGRRMWPLVRGMTFVLGKLPSIEIPQGFESMFIPLEGADPTFFKVAQTTDNNATTGTPNATVTSSKLATDRRSLTVAKGGARTQYSGEMEEDSLIPWAAQLRAQLEKATAEQLEHAIIDGDTETGNSANINDIDGTPAGTEFYLLVNGFRKSPLVTTTANSLDIAGPLTDTAFLDVAWLLGAAGLVGSDPTKVEFIVDPNVAKKGMQLASVKTRDVYSNPTIENGMLASIWNYKVNASWFMHYESAKRMTEATGKIDQTDSDNTKGALLAVRWDQWLFGWKRRVTMETVRIPRADITEITALLRFGLAQRDTEGAAIGYDITL